MHILIIPSWYPSNSNSIRGSFFKEQTEALQRAGNKVGVIYPEARILRFTEDYTIQNLGINTSIINNIPTYRSVFFGKIPGKSYWRERYLWSSDAFKLFRKYLKIEGLPDIVHVHSVLNGGLAALKIKKKYGIPFVVTEHSSGFNQGLFSPRDKILISKILKESACNFSVSPVLSETINKYLDSNFDFKFLPNMVNNNFFNISTKISKKSQNFTFLSVGALTENKNHADLIHAFSNMFTNTPEIKLRIAGGGNLENQLKQLIKEYHMSDQITLLGKISRGDILIEFKNADCFVHTSNYETFGVVIIEAFASGLPVISSECGGPETIINNTNGILYPVGNIEKLNNQLLYMYNNIKKYNPISIQKNCKNSFSEQQIIRTLMDKYQTVLDAAIER